MSVKKKDDAGRAEGGDRQEVLRLAHDLRSLLQFHELIGINSYPKIKKNVPEPDIQAKDGKEGAESVVPSGQPLDSLSEVGTNIRSCSACSFEKKVHEKLLSTSSTPVRLMILGDYCSAEDQKTYFFGRDEDDMLLKMMAAIGLKKEEVYITNCLKCSCMGGSIPQIEHISRCLPFLTREISIVKPPVICAMGELSAKALLNLDEPLIRLRGRFHRYRYFDTHPSVVMPTFHPRFLLAHQEMKRATWQDLQLIQKRFLS